MAVTGMILGIIAVVFAFIPIIGAFIAIPCVGVGLPLAAPPGSDGFELGDTCASDLTRPVDLLQVNNG